MVKSVLKLRFEIETDMIIGNKVPFRNQFSTESFIGARKIRGALLTAIRDSLVSKNEEHSQDSIDSILENISQQIALITPGTFSCPKCETYDTLNGGHAAFLRCKVCHGQNKYAELYTNEDKKCNFQWDFLEQWLKSDALEKNNNQNFFQQDIKKTYPFIECFNGHEGTLEKTDGIYCFQCKGSPDKKSYELKRSTRINVKISKKYRSSVEGNLFEYQVLEKGATFQVTIIGDENALNQFTELDRAFVGRGSSRGFGWVRLIKNDRYSLDKYQNDLQKILIAQYEKYQRIILIATTPIVEFIIDDESYLPESVGYLNKISENWTLQAALGKQQFVSGWSYKSNLQKPQFYAGSPGSIYIYKSEKDSPDYSTIIDYLCGQYLNESQGAKYVPNNFNQFSLWRP